MIRRSIAIAIVLSCVAAGVAVAQSDAKKKEAKKFFRAGEAAYNAGDYVMASEAFEQAYTSLPLPAIAFSTAQAYRLQYFIDKDPRRLKRSIELYRVYIDAVKTGGRRDDAVTNLAELEPIMLRLEAESGNIEAMGAAAPATKIMVSSNVKTARAALDGGKPVSVPLVKEVKAGTYKVVVSAKGYFSGDQEYTVVEGQFRVIEVNLEPKPAIVKLRATSGAQVVVDGRAAGTTPLARPLELAAGRHLITVTARGRAAWSKEIDVERGDEIELSADTSRTLQRKLSYVVLGAGAAGLLLSGITGLSAAGVDGDLNDLRDRGDVETLSTEERDRFNNKLQERDDLISMTYAFLGVGAALVVTGGLLYYMDTPRAESYQPRPATKAADPKVAPVAVAPVVAPDFAGLSVLGRF